MQNEHDLTTEEGCRAEIKRLKALHTSLSEEINNPEFIPPRWNCPVYDRRVREQEEHLNRLRLQRKAVYFEKQRVDCLLYRFEYPHVH